MHDLRIKSNHHAKGRQADFTYPNTLPFIIGSGKRRNSSAEIDYLIESGQDIIPIEVKRGVQGGLKSMNIFIDGKKVKYGIKVSQHHFDILDKIKSVPLFAIEKII